MSIRSVTLTVGALFALSVPASNAAVVLGDGAGPSKTTGRTPAAAANVKHKKSVKHSKSVKKVKDVPPPVPPNYYQVLRNIRWPD